MYFLIGDEGDQTVYVGSECDANSYARTLIDLGRALDVDEDGVELPFRFEMTVSRGKEARLDDWFVVPCLMREDLVAALRAVGVDNLQVFPAEITRNDNGELVPGYVVANIFGTVSCPQVATRSAAPGVAYAFDYEVDPARVGDKLLFRSDEIESLIIAHERVVEVLRARRARGISITSLADTPRVAGAR
ncbi:MAG TPA: hypothetical protein VMJ10_16025 [Kofleriaceae bacterium]|nr:hypothetical protein [Kofleriaceae bacterium]